MSSKEFSPYARLTQNLTGAFCYGSGNLGAVARGRLDQRAALRYE